MMMALWQQEHCDNDDTVVTVMTLTTWQQWVCQINTNLPQSQT